MGNWLHKALGREDSSSERPIPVPFAMTCLCGHALNGMRQDRARRLICSECGRAQFVLPINRYPVSEWKYFAGEQIAEEQTSPDESDERDGGVAMADSAPAMRKPRVASRKPKRPVRNEDDELRIVDDEDDEPERERPQPRRRSVRLDSIEVVTPDRKSSRGKVLMLLATLSVLVIAAVGWMLRQHRRDLAEIRYKQSADSGHLAFEKSDFGKARNDYDEALLSADILGLSAPQRYHVQIRQLHASSILRLVDLDLFELLTLPASEVSDRWVIVHAPVATHAVRLKSRSIVEWDLLGAKKAVRLRGLDEVAEQAKVGGLTEVLFAAQIESIEPDDQGAAYVVQFKKDSAFLWQEFETLKGLGLFPISDEETTHFYRQLIERQVAAARSQTGRDNSTLAEAASKKAGTP